MGGLKTGVIHGFLLLSLDECDDAGQVGVGVVWTDGGDSKASPYGAFVHRIHGRTLRTVEHTGELVKLGHAADHSAGGGRTQTHNIFVIASQTFSSRTPN